MKGSYFVSSTKKKSSSLAEARRLTKKISTNMSKMVNDLTELRKVTEELKNTFDSTSSEDVATLFFARTTIRIKKIRWKAGIAAR